MPIYSVQGPDGRIYDVEGPAGASETDIIAFVQQQLAAGTLKPAGKEGILAALGKGAESTLSQLRTGVSGIFGTPEEAAVAGIERGKKIEGEYADQVSADRIIKAFKEKGILPGIGETVRQIPYAVAEQAPNIATMATGARLGAMAGAPLGPVGALVGGGLGALSASALQQFGGNIERQAQEQQRQGVPVQIDTGAAGAAALGQGALDVAATAIPLGGRLVSKMTGIPMERLLGRTPEQVRKLADERLLTTVSKGLATGALAEIPTEITQQILERAQAGLSLTDEDAMREYGHTAIEVGLLAPFGGMGRLAERGGARQQVAQEQARAKAAAQRAQLEQEEQDRQQKVAAEEAAAARRQTPEYAQEKAAAWEAMQQQVQDLQTRAQAKVPQNDAVAQADKAEAKQLLQTLRRSDEYKTALQEFRAVRPILQQLQAQAQAQAAPAITPELQQADATQQAWEGLQAAQAAAKKQAQEQERQRLAAMSPQEVMVQSYVDQLQQQINAEPDIERKKELQQQLDALKGTTAPVKPDVDTSMVELVQKGFAPAPAPPTPLELYVKRQHALAQQFGHAEDMEALLPYYLQNPELAAQMVAQKVAVPGLRADQNREFLDAIEEDLKAAEARRAAEAAEAAAKEQEKQRVAEQRTAQQKLAKENYERLLAAQQGVAGFQARLGDIVEKTNSQRELEQALQAFVSKTERAPSAALGQMVADINTQPLVANARQQYFALLDQREATKGTLSDEDVSTLNSRINKAKALYEAAAKTAFQERLVQSLPYTGETRITQMPRRIESEKPPAPPPLPQSPEGIKARIDSVLQREDLSDESRALLTRMSEAAPYIPTQGVLNLFNQQITRIENGTDEITKEGAPRRAKLQAFPLQNVPVSVEPPTKAGVADIQRQKALQKAQADAYAAAIKEGKTPAEARDLARAVKLPTDAERYEAKYNEELAKGATPVDAAREAYPLSEKSRKKAFEDAVAQGVDPLEAAKQIVAGARTVKQPAGTRAQVQVGAPTVGKVADITEPTTLRGPSAGERVGLSLAPQVSAALETIEKGRARKQTLAQEREQTLAQERQAQEAAEAEKQATAQRVVQLMQQELQQHEAKAGNFRQKVQTLSKELDDMVVRISEYQTAEQIAATQKSVKKTRAQLVAYNNALLTSGVMDRMKLSGWIDQLNGIKRDLEAQTGGNRKTRRARAQQIERLERDIKDAQNRMPALEQELKYSEAQIEVAEAHARLAELREKAPFQYEVEDAANALERAKAELVRANTSAALLRASLGRVAETERTARKAEAGAASATAREEQERAAREAQQQTQRELEARQGANIGGWRYPMITETQRLVRENPIRITVTKKDQKQLRKDPDRVLRGIRSRITDLENSIKEKMDRTRGFLIAGHEDAKRYDALRQQYEAAKSAEEREVLLPQVEAARRDYDETVNRINGASVLWTGSEKDRRDLLQAYEDEKAFSDFVQSDAFRKEEEGKPQVVLTREQQEKVAEQERAAAAAEAATRAESPETSGEALTRSQTAKAREAQKTGYSSKGVSPAERAKGKSQALIIAQDKQRRGAALTPYEEDLIAEQAKKDRDIAYRSAVKAALDKPADERTEAERLMVEGYEDYRASQKTEVSLEETPEEYTVEDINPDDLDASFVLQKSVESPTIDLAPEAIEALKNNDLLGALNSVQQSSKIEINRVMARRLMMFLRDTQVVVRDDLKNDRGELVYGAATESGDFIYINGKIGFNEETLLHEAVHAATERIVQMDESKLTAQQLAAKRELQALYEAIKADKDITSENAKESLSEFIAEAMSNNLLQRQMSQKKWTFKNAWESFKKVVLTALGIRVPSTMLDAALVATDTLFAQPLVSVKAGAPLVYRKPSYANPGLAAAGEVADKFIQKDRNAFETVRAAAGGFLGLETQLVDRFAGFERLRKLMPELKGSQMMYYLRFYDQRMNLVAQSAGNGALKRVEYTRPDGQKEFIIESQQGASLRGVAETLKEAKDIAGSADAASRLFTLYLSAIRAKDKGFDALHLGEELTEADLNAAMREIQRTPGLEEIFQRARNEYNEYNRGLVGFAVDCGAIPKNRAAELLKENDYIPWYRERNGVAEMVIGKETPIRIGSIAEQPYLHELVGSGKPILDFMVSSVQNTNMLTDMALRNLATKNAVFELVELKLAKITRRPMAGPNVVRFRVQPEEKDDSGERYAMIDTDAAGVPADILVKGMEGIPTQMPFVVRALAMPATLLRRAITLTPLYQARQLFRDSLAAPMLAGADFMPVLGALKEVGSVNKDILERRGVTGGQVFTGGQEDLSKILRDTTNDGLSWSQALSKLEAVAASTDALTRRAQYNSYVSQGLSQMEATLMSLESMNFNKRGASPSIHWLNAMVPFLNAQIQSMNVLYKAMTGKLPFNEKLRIQEKLYTRGMIVAGSTLAYAAAMQDDEAYKNATPDQKYGNWFVRVPGFDEPVRLPVPFEIGYIFKSVPEAIFNSLKNEHGTEEAFKALNQILINTIPGGSSMPTISIGQAKIPLGIPIPQALKTPTELALGKSFFTGRDILSAHEKMLAPEAQFRENTTELAKMFGARTGASPIVLEQLVQGYTGSIGLMFLQALSVGIAPGQSPEKAVKRWSDTPVIGGAFQPNDAGGIINATYDRMVDMQKISRTVDDYITRGELAKAKELIATKSNEYAMAEVADMYVSTMREFTQYETAIRASNLTPEKKREELTRIRQMKIKFSEMVRKAADKTKPQEALS